MVRGLKILLKKGEIFMDVKRAIEVVDSIRVIQVSYEGSLVWIKNIDQQNNTAEVKDINTNREFNVNIRDLRED